MLKSWLTKAFTKKDQCVCHAHSKSLRDAEVGIKLKIECLHADEDMSERLREMGLGESAEVTKVMEGGALILKVHDTKLVLCRDLAEKIIVKDICPCKEHHHV